MKPLNKITVVAWVILLNCSMQGMAQTVKYVPLFNMNYSASVTYPLQTNQAVSLVGYYNCQGGVTGTANDGTTISLSLPSSSNPIQIYTGLTNVILKAGNNTNYVTLQITTPASANVISNYVPADAIVIPTATTGNVQIILESSPDLVNWTAANPGIYGASSAANRFFRVRAVSN